ncbi:MAG: homocysteine S-methyltransferase family protein [Desulfobacterales bacterium]
MTGFSDICLHKKLLLLDGAMGRELKFRGVSIPDTIWSANALLVAPDTVRRIHEDYISAGADIITTNTYGLIREDLSAVGLEDQFEQLNALACTLASEARKAAERHVLIAGSLPPLRGSFRPDLVAPFEEMMPYYQEHAELLAPHVDILLCETMSNAVEGKAAATSACETGKPVWVSWTLHEDQSGRLRSGESMAEAISALAGLPVNGFLVNCSAPESITAAIGQLAKLTDERIGGYANTFQPIPENWRLDGDKESDGFIPLRTDLDPSEYAAHASGWIKAGASIIGGCCGTRPAHIKKLRELIDNC